MMRAPYFGLTVFCCVQLVANWDFVSVYAANCYRTDDADDDDDDNNNRAHCHSWYILGPWFANNNCCAAKNYRHPLNYCWFSLH